MLNANPAVRFELGEWVAEIFENISPNEPHICVYKAMKNNVKKASQDPVDWEPVKKIFFQMKDEGFLDKYKGQKIWLGFPQYNDETGKSEIDFVTINPQPDCENDCEEEDNSCDF